MSAAHRIAAMVVGLAVALLPRETRPWGSAMRLEVAAIERADHAVRFAFGCLGFALQQAAIDLFLRLWPGASNRGTEIMSEAFFGNPRRTAGLCAIAASGLGLAYMSLAGAPTHYLITNVAALALGFAAVGIIALLARSARVTAGTTSLALGAALLVASLFGMTSDGATRWISVGGFSLQPSLILLPVMAIGFARTRDLASGAGIAIAALALALQPDRAMAGALAAGVAALAMLRPERNVLIALAAVIAGFAAALLQPDVQPAMPYVDQILFSSFAVHPLAGLAVIGGAALMIVPAIAGWRRDAAHREAYAMFGAVWLAVIVAAALGNYPTPLVGYGGSAIIGYVVCLLGLPRRGDAGALDGAANSARRAESDQQIDRRIGLSPAL